MDRDEHYMSFALEEARKALAIREVPVGAIIVLGDEIIARGHNETETVNIATRHAEMIAIERASKYLGGWRLLDATMYVTLEPCAMCSGALVASRIKRVVIGTMDEKRGCCGSVINLVDDPAFNHRVEITTGVRAEECAGMLSDFFKMIRETPLGSLQKNPKEDEA